MMIHKLNRLTALSKLLRGVRPFASEKDPQKPRLVNVKVEVDGEVKDFAFPLHTKLAKNLEAVGVPLEFACGFSC